MADNKKIHPGIAAMQKYWRERDSKLNRCIRIGVSVNANELRRLDALAKKLGISRTELLIRSALEKE